MRVSCFGRNNPLITARGGTIPEQHRDNRVVGTDLENEANFSIAPHPFLNRCPLNVCREWRPR